VGVLELRRYRDDDAASVWRLHDEGLRQMGVHAGDGPWDDDVRSVAATYLADRGEFLVGVVAGEVVAMGALRRVSNTVAEVKRMRVDAGFQRRGFGRAVLRGLEARAASWAIGGCGSTRRSSRSRPSACIGATAMSRSSAREIARARR